MKQSENRFASSGRERERENGGNLPLGMREREGWREGRELKGPSCVGEREVIFFLKRRVE